jgi:hypothetical protein
MGEAKRRRDLLANIPNDLKADIATAVRSIDFDSKFGVCGYRALTGARLLHHLGLPVSIAAGGLLYRAGSDPTRDVVAFCGPGNLGYFDPQHGVVGHYWITIGDQIIDFTPGDWPQLKCGDLCFDETDAALGDIQWEVYPPDFYWISRHAVAAYPRPNETIDTCTPALGKVWYTGWRGKRQSVDWQLPWQAIDNHFAWYCQNFSFKERLLSE